MVFMVASLDGFVKPKPFRQRAVPPLPSGGVGAVALPFLNARHKISSPYSAISEKYSSRVAVSRTKRPLPSFL